MNGEPARRRLLDSVLLLAGGFAGASVLTLLHVPAGALIGSVLGSMSFSKLASTIAQRRLRSKEVARRRSLPGGVRVVGQVVLGVLAGTRLDGQTLLTLLRSLLPVLAAVVVILALSVLLARYLVTRHGVDPLTAVMAAAPGGISELAVTAARQGALMHVVLAIHLFRVLIVVLVVLPILLTILRHT